MRTLTRPSGSAVHTFHTFSCSRFCCFCYTCAAAAPAFLINSLPPYSQTALSISLWNGMGWEKLLMSLLLLLLFTFAAAHPPPLSPTVIHLFSVARVLLHLFFVFFFISISFS
jgi:hypothetical protein